MGACGAGLTPTVLLVLPHLYALLLCRGPRLLACWCSLDLLGVQGNGDMAEAVGMLQQLTHLTGISLGCSARQYGEQDPHKSFELDDPRSAAAPG